MSGVTWGSNTVHTFGGTPAPAPSGFGFGAPSPAPAPSSFSFGGAPSPAPASGGFGFGSSTTTKPLFGAPAPAPATGGFGSFGSSFGTQQQQQTSQVPQHHIPAQAAMQVSAKLVQMPCLLLRSFLVQKPYTHSYPIDNHLALLSLVS